MGVARFFRKTEINYTRHFSSAAASWRKTRGAFPPTPAEPPPAPARLCVNRGRALRNVLKSQEKNIYIYILKIIISVQTDGAGTQPPGRSPRPHPSSRTSLARSLLPHLQGPASPPPPPPVRPLPPSLRLLLLPPRPSPPLFAAVPLPSAVSLRPGSRALFLLPLPCALGACGMLRAGPGRGGRIQPARRSL